MKLKLVFFSFFITFLVSCTLEKMNISPISNMFLPKDNTSVQGFTYNIHTKTDIITYSSELTNHISSFPKTSSKEMNTEVNELKKRIKNYVYILQEYNIKERQKAFFEVESSYKKLQKLRKKLPYKEDQLINLYLVKIKGNITKLEALSKQDSTIIK